VLTEDDAPWRCRILVTKLRVATEDQTIRPYTATELAEFEGELNRFAQLAGMDYLPHWIRSARRRLGIAEGAYQRD
jgi:hypothetical protein